MPWTLADAKNRFSAVVQAALTAGPQRVTRRGAPAVVVLAEVEYDRLRAGAAPARPSMIDHLLAIPPIADPEAAENFRSGARPRAVDVG